MVAGQLPEGARFYTVKEVAAYLRTSQMTIYRMIHQGDMPSVRVGRGFRIPAELFKQWEEGADG